MSENILQKRVSWTSYSAIKPLDKPKLPTYMIYFLLFSRILSNLLKFTGVSLQKKYKDTHQLIIVLTDGSGCLQQLGDVCVG